MDSNMKLLSVFRKSEEKHYLEYEDFRPLRWSRNDFLRYISYCDEIRSATIVANCIAHHDGKKQIKGAQINNLDQYTKFLVERRVEFLFHWLSQFCDKPIPKPQYAYEYFSSFSRYGLPLDKKDFKYESLYGDNQPNPRWLHMGSFDFTHRIEVYVYRILNGESPFDTVETKKDINKMSVKELKHRINRIEIELKYLEEPVFPEKMAFGALIRWAKEQCSYEKVYDLEDELELCKERLEELDFPIPAFNVHKHTLYVYNWGNIICKKQQHELADVNCIIPMDKKRITINAQYCCNCRKFIISEKGYQDYLGRYKLFPVKAQYVDEDGCFPQELYRTDRAEKSPLNLAGYSVSKQGGLSESERQRILVLIMKNGVLTKNEIINYLEMFIMTNGMKGNMTQAVYKWQSDLNFVKAYNMDRQDNYVIDHVARYKR